MPKQVHNVRVRVHEEDAVVAGKLCNQIMKDAGVTLEDVELHTQYDEGTGLTIMELWADRQQHVRKIFGVFVQELSKEDREEILQHPGHYIDTGTHCFFRLDKTALAEGKYVLLAEGECAHVRMNIAAFPATRENAIKILTEIFSE